MASRHEIVTIDFRANAAKANPAMDSLRQACHDLNVEMENNKKLREEGIKSGMAQSEIEKLDATIKGQLRTLNSYNAAINTLSKGVGTLARAIDAFNAGTLDKMNAAFQKQSFNAAENAKKLLVPGTEGYEKNMAELDALQQKNLENLAKYKLRTEQLLQSIGDGGKISATDLKTEADGLEELMKLLPHLGNEWQEYYQILLRVRDAIKQQADEEKRLKGAIADANDARARSAQLTKQGAEEARQQHEAAKKEVESETAIINKLKEEQAEKKKNMADSAAILQQKDKEIESQRKTVAVYETAIKNEKKDTKAREDRIIALKQENETLQTTAEANRKAVDQMKGDMKGLEDQLKDVNAELEKMGVSVNEKPAAVTTPASSAPAATKKEETQAVEEKTEADKKEEQAVKGKTKAKEGETQAVKENTAAKKEEAQATVQAEEAEKKEVLSKKEIEEKLKTLKTELGELYEQRKLLLEQHEQDKKAAEEEAAAVEREANAFANLSKEEANALLQKKQAMATFKSEGGKISITNREEAQSFLMSTIRGINNGNLNIESSPEKMSQVFAAMQERYGLKDESEALSAVRSLVADGGLIEKGGFATKFFITLKENIGAVRKFEKDIRDLTNVVNGNAEATEENTAAREKFIATASKLSEVENTIAEKESQKTEYAKLNMKIAYGEIKTTETLTQKTQKLTEAQKKKVEAIREEIDAIKKMSKEEAGAAFDAAKNYKAEVKYKQGKLYSSDMNEVHQWIIGEMKKLGAKGTDGTLELKGDKVTELVKKFKDRYNAVDKNAPETDLTFAKGLLEKVLKSGDGMLAFGDSKLKGKGQSITIEYVKDIFNALIEKNKQLIVAKTGAKKVEDELDGMLSQATATENQNTEATERNTQAKGRKAKATKAAADAQKEQNKADGESIAQGQQLSAEEQKKQELLRKRETLQGQLNEKQEKANQLEEQAAGADTKMKNNLKTITDLQNENINAHTKNEQGYKREKENLEKLESQQDKNIHKYNEDKEAVEGLTQKIDEHATKRADANKRAAQTERLTIDAMNDAIKALEAENHAIDPQSAKWQENTRVIQQYKAEIDRLKNQPVLQMMTERMGNIRNLSADALTETKRFWEQMAAGAEHGSHKLAVYEGNLKVIAEEERQRQQQIQAPMRERLSNLGRLSTADLTETKRYWQTVRDGADQTSAAYKKAELAVKALTNEENRRKANAQAQYINDQMKDLNNLSVTGLAEVKRYWQAMADGARRGSDEAKDAANALARINEVELRNTKQQVRPLFGDLSKKGTEEIRAAIEAGRRLIDTYDSGSPAAQRLAQAIVDAEEHLKKYGVEAERAARREAAAVEEAAQRRKEQDSLMRQQLDQGTALSDSALKAQQQYWQRLIDDPKTAKESLAGYRYELERTIELQEQQANATRDKYAARLSMPNQFANLSEAELRQSIEAGKQLLSTYKSGSAEAEQLAKNILAAENNIKTYGLEAQRAAQKEAQAVADAEQKRRDADTTMRKQLYNTKDLTESALKAQEQYWKRLIDDPNTAAASLDRYRKDLEQVHLLQEQMEQQHGADTLQRAQNGEFATASMDELDKTIKKLKEYQALIKDPNGAGKEAFGKTKEQVDALTEQLNKLKGVAEKVKGSFKDAEEVLARFDEHMNAGKTASEGMAQSLDEKLAGKTSSYDALIEENIKEVERYEQNIKEATQELANMEKELAELEAKHKNSSWFRKQTKAYQQEGWRIEDLRDEIEGHEVKRDDGSSFRTGQKQWIEYLQDQKQNAQGWVDYYKKQKAEELGITEEVEEKKQEAQRLTQEQMQEGIKLLEEEYRKTDHTTAEGIKRRELLRQVIDQMNQEIKESTGEWMSLAQAEELASKAGTSGFFATSQQMQQATQAIERQRDALVKTIQQKQRDGEATKKEEEELQRLEKVLKDLKFEQDNFNMSHKQMEDLLKHPKKADDLDQLKAAIKRADGELHRMKQSLGDNNDQYRKFAAEVKAAKNELKMMEGQAKATTGQLEKAWSRLKTYVGLYMGFNMAWQKFTGTIGDMKELSDRMGEVGKTTQMAAGEIARMTTNLSKMDTRTALTSLVELSAKAGQLGLKSREDVEGFTEAANKMLVALPEMGADGATQMMKVALATGEVAKIQKEMDDGLIEGSSATAVAMEKIASTIDQLRANSAAAAPQITDFVKRVGAVGAQSGITIDQVAALGSTVDALGLRVEMSATALSRMIPAIKANAFEVAKAIGMAPEALRAMFDEAGGGMNAMLAVFQHIKDSGMDADSIENMLGMGGMRDVMKDLNQQGARAGIVFAGLSQNVDVLREHLGIAKTAYEENIAIQQEYDRMNETTAAKWERLGNQIEEMFVGPGTQSVLGDIADGLRVIVDLVSGPLNTAFWATSAAVLSIKSGLTSLPEAGGKVLDYLRESAAKAGEALQEAAARGAEMSNATKGMEQAADAVDDIGDALDEAQEAGEQAGEAMETATGAIAGMNGAAKVSIFSINGLKMAWKGLDATMKANIIVAVIALLWTLGKAIYNIVTEVYKHNKAVADANAMIQIATDRFEGYWQKLKDTKTALDNAKKSTDGLKEGSDELTKATVEVTKADNNHRAAIADINGIYGKYLGFMLTETNYANLAAAAHDKITAAIRREMLAKQEQAAIDQVTQENTENLKGGLANLTEELRENGRLDSQQAAQAKQAVQEFMRKNIKYNADKQDFDISESAYKYLQNKGANRGKLQGMDANKIAAAWFYEYLKDTFHLGDAAVEDITGVYRQGGGYGSGNIGGRNFRGDYASAYLDNMKDVADIQDVFRGERTSAESDDKKSTQALVKRLQKQAKEAQAKITNKSTSDKERNKAYEDLANSLEGLDTSIDQLNPMGDKELVDSTKKLADDISKSVDKEKLTRARTNARSIFARATGGPGGESPLQPLDPTKNPWGSNQPAESTDWKNMTAEQLVNRRKQMKDFVNAIQTDTDVQAVLKEDAALKKAIEKGMSSDMRTVIEWYNSERLKIQDELHARHLTNTGDWMDPKKQRNAHKQFKAELDAYLEELDAYYTERKAEIEKARSDEEITEGEAWRRNLKNENEWYNRRAELLKLYAEKSGEVTQAEQDAIVRIIAERTGDSVEFVRAMIKKTIGFAKQIEASGEKGAAMVHDWYAKIDLKTQQSMLKSQQAITKQVKFIEDTLAKERPYDGITKNLQDNLDKMGVLAAKMRRVNDEMTAQDKEPKYSNADITAQSYKEVAFFLNNAADAWSIDIDELLRRMAREGMETTAEEISKSDMLKQAVMGQLRKTYQEVQDAVKKEASQIKKNVEIIWNDEAQGIGGKSMKSVFDQAIARLGMQQDSVSRANSLIGAGPASDNVATRLAMKQIEVQMRMQKAQYDMYRTQANQRIAMLKAEAAEHERIARQMKQENNLIEEARQKTLAVGALKDAENVKRSLGLTLAEETKKEEEQMAELLKLQEESQNRLYTSLREWADLLASSLQGVMEASHTADRDYYNERAKLNLTGKGGPGAGTYIVIDNEGTSDARAHYEYLDERQALERQREIENDNAVKDAWKKMLDDLNQKMSDTITDQLNAMLQAENIDKNTQAVIANTEALWAQLGQGGASDFSDASKLKRDKNGMAVDESGQPIAPIQPVEQTGEAPAWKPFWQMTEEEKAKAVEDMTTMYQANNEIAIAAETEKAAALAEIPGYTPSPLAITEEQVEAVGEKLNALNEKEIETSKIKTDAILANQQKVKQGELQTDQQMTKSSKASFAAMTAAANMYGIAYQAMSNENLSTTQKVEMMMVQAAGQAAISMLTASMAASTGETAANAPAWMSKFLKDLGPYAGPVAIGVFTALLGGLMGIASSKITKSKSEIAQATGASMSAGRLSTGMMTYAEGNVNEFTDPATLTPGRSYNVDAADGKTYRAKYTGTNPRTHLTSGPEFHLVGEAGREAIIDAHTTRLMQMDDTGIWNAIQTLYNGGRISQVRRRRSGMGVRAFAGGNLDEFEEMADGMGMDGSGTAGMGTEQMAAFQSSIDRNNELLERALTEGIHARFDVYGKGGLIDSYDQGKKTASRHGEKY